MTNQPQQLTVTDPDNVPELLCDGQFNVTIAGNLAILTFTHVRPDATRLFRDGTVEPKAVVRARIAITVENLAALRDLLNQVIQAPDTPAPPAGGPTRH
jgi:hypothetical protein